MAIAAVIGLGTAAYGAYSASKSKKEQLKGIQEGAERNYALSKEGIEAQKALYADAVARDEPFRQTKLRGLIGMEALSSGGFKGFGNVPSYTKDLTKQVDDLNAKIAANRAEYQTYERFSDTARTAPEDWTWETVQSYDKIQKDLDAKEKSMQDQLTSFNVELGALKGAPGSGIEGFDPKLQGLSSYEQMQQGQGEKAIQRSLAARGQFFSGAGLEQLGKFNKELLASSGQRQFSQYAQLAGLSPMGSSGAPPNLTGGYANLGQIQGSALQQAGQVRGLYYSGMGEAAGGVGSNLAQLYGGGAFSNNNNTGGNTNGYNLGSDNQFQLKTGY